METILQRYPDCKVAVGILNKSFFGRYFYAIGGNEEAAELSGIRVNRMKYLIYALPGVFAGLAGIVLLSRSGSAQSTVGKGLVLAVAVGIDCMFKKRQAT